MRLRAFWLIAVLVLGSASTALADNSIIVLGLRSVEGDDEAALGLSRALREAGDSVPGWKMRQQAVTLAQMSLAHGCDDVDARCLADIAKALNTDLVMYGTMRRTSARDDYQLTVRIELFDASTGAIAQSATATFGQDLRDEALRPVADDLLAQMTPKAAVPELVIETNVPGAEVRLNGQLMGQVQGDTFYLRNLEPGRYVVQVTAVGYAPFEQEVELAAGEPASVNANLDSATGVAAQEGQGTATQTGEHWEVAPAEPDGHIPMWIPVTLFAVAGVSLGATIWSWVEISGIEDEPDYVAYSNALYNRAKMNDLPASTYDICGLAALGDAVEGDLKRLQTVQDLCDKADTLEVLQYVFLGTAVAAAGTGVALLLIDQSASDTESAASFSVQPQFGSQRTGFTATLRF